MDDFESFIKELESQPSVTVGEVFIGFTGTPLLKKDRATSLEIFGGYIHTYKFREAVEDEVVLDLVYEARDIDQVLGSQDKIDAWFDAKTKGLNDWQKAELRQLVGGRGQTADGFRCATVYLSLHRQIHAGSWVVSGHLPHRWTARTRSLVTSSITRICSAR